MDVAPPVSPDVFFWKTGAREIRYDLTIIVPVHITRKTGLERNVWSRSSCKKQKYLFLSDNWQLTMDRRIEAGKFLNPIHKNPCVVVIRQENKGYSGARNTGLEKSKSKYIMFVDSDDVLLPNAIGVLACQKRISGRCGYCRGNCAIALIKMVFSLE
ncbi:MAG: glycosyltransferase family A protein [Fusicatenibacter saccharivorans]